MGSGVKQHDCVVLRSIPALPTDTSAQAPEHRGALCLQPSARILDVITEWFELLRQIIPPRSFCSALRQYLQPDMSVITIKARTHKSRLKYYELAGNFVTTAEKALLLS